MFYSEFEIPLDYQAMGLPHDAVMPTVTTYILDAYPKYQNPKKRPVVILCPGGGYGHHSPREGEAIAIRMNSLGFHALVLRYSLAPNEYPCAMLELAWTVNYARTHAAQWDADPRRIIAGGFSAGGHVAAALAVMWQEEEMRRFARDFLHTGGEGIRPDGLLLGYPVLTSGEFAHEDSFRNLLGSGYEALKDKVSLEKRVTSATPVTFLWHTFEDASVPLENTLLFANALRKEKIPFELHVFPRGSHGLGLATRETDTKDGKKYQPECACWVEMFGAWVENNI